MTKNKLMTTSASYYTLIVAGLFMVSCKPNASQIAGVNQVVGQWAVDKSRVYLPPGIPVNAQEHLRMIQDWPDLVIEEDGSIPSGPSFKLRVIKVTGDYIDVDTVLLTDKAKKASQMVGGIEGVRRFKRGTTLGRGEYLESGGTRYYRRPLK